MTCLVAGASLPMAGALQPIEPRTISPRSIDVDEYVQQVTAHCPYLASSLRHGVTGWTVYQLTDHAATSDDQHVVEADVFIAGARAAEWLRPLIRRPHGVLRCENVVVLGAGTGEALDWPHWALKHLYGSVGIMVGKFRAREQIWDREGRSIPPPPVSFLPVRPAVRTRDPRFLAKTPELAQALAAAEDDGRDVFAHHRLSRDWKDIRAWAAQRRLPVLSQPSPSHEPPAEPPSA